MPSIETLPARPILPGAGEAPLVLALHASASSGRQWRSLESAMPGCFEVAAPDLSGYGASALAPVRALADEAAPVLARLRERGRPAHLVGHSFGGAVAVKVALEAPGLVASLSLFEPVLFHLLRQGTPADRRLFGDIERLADDMADAAAHGKPQAAMAGFIDFWNGDGAFERMGAGPRDALSAQTGHVLANFAAGLAETWPARHLARIACPTLTIMALGSRGVARRVTEIAAGAMPGARLTMLAGVGHMAPVTHPERVGPLVIRHIAAAEHRRTAAAFTRHGIRAA
jgi:pimeloyl-ACP methyl ester carboxylesterase